MKLPTNTINSITTIEKQNNKISDRSEYLDWLKGLAIFLVVFAHCPIESSTFWLIYRFHMPLFFCISGYLFKNTKKFKDFFVGKFKTLIIPYIIFFIISYIISTLWLNLDMTLPQMLKSLFLNGKYCSKVNNWAIWYLPSFFIATNIFYFISKIKNKYLFSFILFALFMATVPFYDIATRLTSNGYIPFSVQVLPAALFYMGIGYICNKLSKINFTKRVFSNYKVLSLICIILFTFGIILSIKNSDQIIKISTYKYVIASLLIIPLIINLTMRSKNKVIIYLGQNSLIILGVHRTLIALLEYYKFNNLLNKYNIRGNISALFIAIIVITFICIVYELLKFIYQKIKYRVSKSFASKFCNLKTS